ncbi:MAG: histidinol-phosphate transaminase [Promethearchaeota archaeon]
MSKNAIDLINKLKRKSLLNYTPYTYGEQPDPKENWIKLNTNENPYPPPPQVLEEIKNAVNENLKLYPDPLCKELRHLLIEKIIKNYNKNVSMDNVIVGNGSDEIIDILMKAFIDLGDNIVIFKPSYGMYPAVAALYQANIIEIPLKNDFSIPIENIPNKGKILFICSPNNPTGTSVKNDTIQCVCDQFEGLVVVDEAYGDFSKTTAFSLIDKYQNLAVMRTFSKSYSLASMRVGYLVANQEIIKNMIDVKLPYNVPYLSQICGIATLHNIELYEEFISKIISERERLAKEFLQLGIKVYPSDSNFILIEFDNEKKATQIFNSLKSKKVLVRRYSSPNLLKLLRISIGTEYENNQLLKIFKNEFKKI